jgi:hypothetical protein
MPRNLDVVNTPVILYTSCTSCVLDPNYGNAEAVGPSQTVPKPLAIVLSPGLAGMRYDKLGKGAWPAQIETASRIASFVSLYFTMPDPIFNKFTGRQPHTDSHLLSPRSLGVGQRNVTCQSMSSAKYLGIGLHERKVATVEGILRHRQMRYTAAIGVYKKQTLLQAT